MLYCINCKIYCSTTMCDICGKSRSIVDAPKAVQLKSPYQQKKEMSAKELLARKTDFHKITGFDFLGELPKRFSVLLYGKYGSGKSTFALKFADKLAENHNVAYLATEEGFSESFRKKLIDNNIGTDKITVYNEEVSPETLKKIKNSGCRHLFVDSITVNKVTIDTLIKMFAMIPGIMFLVSHATKADSFRGTMSFGHYVDIVLYASDGIVSTEKNRYAPRGAEYKVFDETKIIVPDNGVVNGRI